MTKTKIKDLFNNQFPEVELGLAKGEFDWLKTDLVEIVNKEISNALDMIVLERRKANSSVLGSNSLTLNDRQKGYNQALTDTQAKIAKIKSEL